MGGWSLHRRVRGAGWRRLAAVVIGLALAVPLEAGQAGQASAAAVAPAVTRPGQLLTVPHPTPAPFAHVKQARADWRVAGLARAQSAPPGPHTWPAAGAAIVDVSAVRAQTRVPIRATAAGTPVFATPASSTRPGPSRVVVTVASQAVARRLGVTGVVFSVAAVRGSGPLVAGIDYRAFADAYGGDFGSRLQLIELPGCTLTRPSAAKCLKQRPVRGAVNLAGQRQLSGLVTLSSGGRPVVLAATSTTVTTNNGNGGNDGGGTYGSFTATSLKPAGSWSAGGSTGDFTYSYPVPVPPAPSGMAPTLSLNYNSGLLDGQTSAAQQQANWLGDGWSTPDNFIEQTFVPCTDEPEGSAPANNSSPTNDNCYNGQVLSLSLNGQSGSIVYDSSLNGGKGGYVPADANGDTIQKITGSNNGTGTYDTSYWVITDRSGTKYYFGLNQLPGWSSGKPVTNSVDYEPVYCAHSGDPCYKAGDWAGSVKNMAYRWHLDYVVDAHNNAMAWYYHQDTNSYLQDAASTYTTMPNADATYVRDSYLDHIDYGFSDQNAYTVNGGHAPDQVVFSTDGRCIGDENANPECPAITTGPPPNFGTPGSVYPDVPWDLHCDLGDGCLVASPTFWSTAELSGITTQQWTGSGYTAVDQWDLTQSLPSTSDGSSPTLFLASITRTGKDTSAGGSAVGLPAVVFTPVNETNRVQVTVNGVVIPAMSRARISQVDTESGAVITVNYTQAVACDTSVSPVSSNKASCFPQWWTPSWSSTPVMNWFNKWQVSSVTTDDPSGGSAQLKTSYSYKGGAAWHFDDNEAVRPKYRTYSQYRGFGEVQTITGSGGGSSNDTPAVTDTTYYRGMSGDNGGPAVTLKDSQGGAHDDTNQLAGDTLEVTSCGYDQTCSTGVAGSAIYSYWVSGAAATRDRSAQKLPDLTANATGLVETWARQALHSGTTTTWRDTETDTSYDTATSSSTFGLPQYTYDHGDLSLTGNNQVRCTAISYANSGGGISGLVSKTETDADPCGGSNPGGASAPGAGQVNKLTAPTAASRPGDVVSATCTVYDDASLAQNPPPATTSGCPASTVTTGDVSEVYKASSYLGTQFTYQLQKAAVYDSLGRVTKSWDGNINLTKTAYTANSYGLTTGVTTTNPLGQSSSVALDPARGTTTNVSDINDITTVTHYDGLGRVTAVWEHNRYSTPSPPPADATFTYTTPTPPPPPVKGETQPATAPWAVTTGVLNFSQQYAYATSIYDALLRPRETQDPTPQGGRLVTDTIYDSHGWVWKTNNHWWDSSARPAVTLALPQGTIDPPAAVNHDQAITAFDGLGRPVLATSYDGITIKSQSATAYDQAAAGSGDATITVPLHPGAGFYDGYPYNGGGATAAVTDAAGRTTQLQQYTSLPAVAVSQTLPTTVSITGGTAQATSYAWDNAMQTATVTDGSKSWVSYSDLLGHVIKRTDPDSGTTTMQYDQAGNLTQSTDANNATLSWTYDAMNRKTAEYDAATSAQSPSNELASWVYDNSDNAVTGMSNPLGHLTGSTRYIGGNTLTGGKYVQQATGFNEWGEPYGTTVTLPKIEGILAGSYTFSYHYTPITGNPAETDYPASPGAGALPAEAVLYGYEQPNNIELFGGLGGLVTDSNPPHGTTSSSYVNDITYTPQTQPGSVQLTSGTAPLPTLTDTWDPHTGQLTSTQLTTNDLGGTPVDATTYSYDPAGNPVSQTATRTTTAGSASETQCYSYDPLGRLTEAWTANDACKSAPSSSTIGDQIAGSAYWTSWKYTAYGLRTTETGHGLNGAADTTTTYGYNGNGTSQPDTLTSTASVGADTGTATYKYDADGNVTSRAITDTTSTSQTLTWNDDGTLGSVTSNGATSSYIYDASGQLLLQKDPGATTLYLPGEQLTLNTSTGAVNGTRYYSLPGGVMAVRTGTTTSVSAGTSTTSYGFELTSLHGTGTLSIGSDLKSSSAVWRAYTPFGAPRGTMVAWPDNHGFLNKPTDSGTGLTSIGARWYDPGTATFQSIDPVFETTSPQEQNGYTYAAQNPITNADPTGLRLGCYANCQPPPPPPPGPGNGGGGCNPWIQYCSGSGGGPAGGGGAGGGTSAGGGGCPWYNPACAASWVGHQVISVTRGVGNSLYDLYKPVLSLYTSASNQLCGAANSFSQGNAGCTDVQLPNQIFGGNPHSPSYQIGYWGFPFVVGGAGEASGLFARLFRGLMTSEETSSMMRTVEILGPKEFNPSSLQGLTPSEVRSSIPSDWVQGASKSGGGEVFRDPANFGRQIRIMPGYPAGSRPDLITTGPYAVVSQNGITVKIPLFGNPVLP